MQEKISFKEAAALPYIKEVAISLRKQAIEMIQELPEEMVVSGKAVNASIKNKFQECNFLFALFVEKDEDRPTRKTLGISTMSSLAMIDCTNYIINRDNARLIDYIKNELTDEKCAEMLWNLMKYVYKKATD